MSARVRIRRESPADAIGVRRLLKAAFDTPAEARLAERLRAEAPTYFALVAMSGGRTVGYVAFTAVSLKPAESPARVAGLAPMAVLPGHQRQGIGRQLVETGIARCWVEAYDAIVVVGAPEFYARFGFGPAGRFGLACEFDVPPDAFLAMELKPGALGRRATTVHYHAAFRDV